MESTAADPQELIGALDVAHILGCSHRAALYYLRDGLIPGVRIGTNWVVRRGDVAKFVPPKRGRASWKTETVDAT